MYDRSEVYASLLMQVFSPTIIPPTKWYQTNVFWGGVGLLVTFASLGVSMTARVALAHIFFTLAWPSGCMSLWVMCNGVFKKNRILIFSVFALLLGVLLFLLDHYLTTHPAS
jgi:hypothetical protein